MVNARTLTQNYDTRNKNNEDRRAVFFGVSHSIARLRPRSRVTPSSLVIDSGRRNTSDDGPRGWRLVTGTFFPYASWLRSTSGAQNSDARFPTRGARKRLLFPEEPCSVRDSAPAPRCVRGQLKRSVQLRGASSLRDTWEYMSN